MFPTTRWTLILVSRKDGEAEKAALDQLFATYWKPIYFFLRRKGLAPESATSSSGWTRPAAVFAPRREPSPRAR